MRHTLLPLCAETLLAATLTIIRRCARRRYPTAPPNRSRRPTRRIRAIFDYLLGDWEFTSVSRDFGAGRGYWSAVRPSPRGRRSWMSTGVVGDSGQTYYASATLRAYNAVLDRWELVSAEQGNGLQNVGTAHKGRAEMAHRAEVRRDESPPVALAHPPTTISAGASPGPANRRTDGGKTWTAQWLRSRPTHRAAAALGRSHAAKR